MPPEAEPARVELATDARSTPSTSAPLVALPEGDHDLRRAVERHAAALEYVAPQHPPHVLCGYALKQHQLAVGMVGIAIEDRRLA